MGRRASHRVGVESMNGCTLRRQSANRLFGEILGRWPRFVLDASTRAVRPTPTLIRPGKRPVPLVASLLPIAPVSCPAWTHLQVAGATRQRLWWENDQAPLTTDPQFPSPPTPSLPANGPLFAGIVLVLLVLAWRLRRSPMR